MKKRLLPVLLALALCLGLTVPAMAAGDAFTDVTASHWARDGIEDMAARKVVNGVGGKFDPDAKVSCADFSTMVARLLFPVELRRHGEDSPWWKAGVRYRAAGENIAAGQSSVAEVMTAWMNSPGHRANILKSGFSRIGIGFVYTGSGYRAYWTQMFAD